MNYVLLFLGYPLYLLVIALVRELLVSDRFIYLYNAIMGFVSLFAYFTVIGGILETFTNNSLLMTLAVIDVIVSMSAYTLYLSWSDKTGDCLYSLLLTLSIIFSIAMPASVYGTATTNVVSATVISVTQPTSSRDETILIVKDSKGKRHVVTSDDATTLQPQDKTKVNVTPNGWVLPE